MNKRKVVITEMVKNTLFSSTDIEGEWNTTCDIDFMLEESCTFNIFGKEFVIDRVKMGTTWCDGIYLNFANKDTEFNDFMVGKKFIHPIYLKVIEEEKGGILQGWLFSEELYEMLIDKGERNYPRW